jgi:hypothetical protein
VFPVNISLLPVFFCSLLLRGEFNRYEVKVKEAKTHVRVFGRPGLLFVSPVGIMKAIAI